MTTTGTYAFNPAASNLMLVAFGRINIRRTEITTQHLEDAFNEANLLQVEFSNRQPNLWSDELYDVTLVEGTASYELPARMVAIQAAYLSTTNSGVTQDTIIWPISTFEYAALPNKTQEAVPTSYWYRRQITPEIYVWPVPDGNADYTLHLRILHQIQDASLTSGATLDLPYRWLDTWVANLAARLAEHYPDALTKAKGPNAVTDMAAKAERSWTIAATEDQERVPLMILPSSMSYWR